MVFRASVFGVGACVLLWAAVGAPSAGAEGENGFVPLFSGEGSPEGWSVRAWNDLAEPAAPEARWTVQDGVLRSGSHRGTWLVSDRQFADFVLRFEFRLGALGNSGVALRAPLRGDPAFDGMELQLADERYNPEANEAELTGSIYRALAPRRQVYRPTEWNRCEILLQGTRLQVELNGERIVDEDLAEHDRPARRHDGSLAPPLRDRPRRGHIGFQHLSRDDQPVEIRRAEIKEL